MNNNDDHVKWLKVETGIVHFNPNEKIFAKPIPCSEILLLQLPVGKPEKLYGECHIAHTDQLKLIEGQAIVLTIYNKSIYYIPLTRYSDVLVIPTSTWHSVINMSDEPTNYQNWLVRKRPSKAKDYFPILIQHQFDNEIANKALTSNSVQTIKL